jgi:Ca-activated chloride channel family protein
MRLACLLLAIALAAPLGATAQHTNGSLFAIHDPGDLGSGTLAWYSDGQMLAAPLLDAQYDLSIGGMLARTRLQQSFENTTGEWLEAIYVYPLPDGARVDFLELIVGNRRIDGEIKERTQARSDYEQARSQGQRAGLLESERPNLFTTTVSNIAPGERVSIRIAYQQNVRFDSGLFSVRLPLVLGPRYIPGEQLINDTVGAARISPPVNEGAPRNPASITVKLDAGMPITEARSLYHDVTQRIVSQTARELSLAHSHVPADRDFVLEWRAAAAEPVTALFREWLPSGEYSLLQFFPPQGLMPPQLARDIVFVIDTSGSMDGTSIEQAREALLFGLDQLSTNDRFNILRFASDTQLLHRQPISASAAEVHTAKAWVRRLTSGGGTEMFPAVNAALRQFSDNDPSRVRQVVFITDGNVGNEQALFELIKAHLDDTRLYTIGIGSAPNGYFMATAARYGRGTHTFIGDVSEVSERMTSVFEKIAAPVLTDIEIDWPDGAVRDIYPQRLPDLFAGEPMLVSIRGGLPESLTVRGRMVGAPWSQQLATGIVSELEGVGRHWASARVAALLESQHQRSPGDPIYDAVVATALEHGIVTRYTSLLAIDQTPARAQGQPLAQQTVPINLPAGWRAAGVSGRLPGTATSAGMYLAFGLSFGFLALTVWLLGRRTLCDA